MRDVAWDSQNFCNAPMACSALRACLLCITVSCRTEGSILEKGSKNCKSRMMTMQSKSIPKVKSIYTLLRFFLVLSSPASLSTPSFSSSSIPFLFAAPICLRPSTYAAIST